MLFLSHTAPLFSPVDSTAKPSLTRTATERTCAMGREDESDEIGAIPEMPLMVPKRRRC
jgi:hypothetical protein